MDAATKSVVFFGVIGLLLAGSVIALFQVRPGFVPIPAKDGTVSIYMESIQPDISGNPTMGGTAQPADAHVSGRPSGSILSLNVTIDSVSIHESGEASDSWVPISNARFTFDVLKPFNVSKLIAMGRVPQENVTMVRLHVATATAAVEGVVGLRFVKVPSDDLKVPVNPALQVKAQLTSSVTISGSAHIVFEGTGQIMLTPVLHAERTTGPQ